MGVAKSTAGAYLTDPDLSKQRTRRHRYEGKCFVCGGVTDGSDGYGTATDLCQTCRAWPEDTILAAMRQWADEHGGVPPSCTDWRRGDVDHPAATLVCRRFNWNEMLLKAGFALRCDRRPETHEWIVERLRAGDRTEEIADRLGVSVAAIYNRFSYRGQSVTDIRTERLAA